VIRQCLSDVADAAGSGQLTIRTLLWYTSYHFDCYIYFVKMCNISKQMVMK